MVHLHLMILISLTTNTYSQSIHLFTPLEVSKLLHSMPGKSSPLDFIPTSLLKSCSDTFSILIAHLANLSFSQGVFPSKFKLAQISPLLKKPGLSKSDPSNFRPISNLNTIGKILERLALARLLPHLSISPSFSPLQSAYRKFHSTETALLKLTNDIMDTIDSGKVTILAALDMSAAFDTLDHTTLLHRLEHTFGWSGTVHTWIHSYLTNRSSFVKIDSSLLLLWYINHWRPSGFSSRPSPFCFVYFASSRCYWAHSWHSKWEWNCILPPIRWWHSVVHRCKFFNTCSSNSIYRGVHSTSSRLAFEQWSSPQPIEVWGHCFLEPQVKTTRCFGRVCWDHHSCWVSYQTPVIYKKV